jgi:hypothetical protein
LDRKLGGPRAVLDAVMKRKIPSPRRESNPRIPIVQPIAQNTIVKQKKKENKEKREISETLSPTLFCDRRKAASYS